ncbi:hypothetical protein FJZ17_01995 [Candidatus Pacearchaeota archaeon]|nr:hypothetical protein [Candidatus Pacearchaeota archaeon]
MTTNNNWQVTLARDEIPWVSMQDNPKDFAVITAKEWISKHFSDGNLKEFVGYRARNNLGVIEAINAEDTQGYAFVGELQLDRDIERRLADVRRIYEGRGRSTQRVFLDLRDSQRYAGLEWRRYASLNPSQLVQG